MNHWFLLVQLGVGGLGAWLFLSALADAFSYEEQVFAIRKRQWERDLPDEDEDEVVIQIDPQSDAVPIVPAN